MAKNSARQQAAQSGHPVSGEDIRLMRCADKAQSTHDDAKKVRQDFQVTRLADLEIEHRELLGRMKHIDSN